MTAPPEPFFTEGETNILVLFRPGDWRGWWGVQPRTGKAVVVVAVALLGFGLYGVTFGSRDGDAILLLGLCAFPLEILLLLSLKAVLVAPIRWGLRRSGIASLWRRVRGRVISAALFLFWMGVIGLVIIGAWPYLSSDPTLMYYSFKTEIPTDHVTVEKEPHDCEFSTAPLGNKNCHYEAQIDIIKATDRFDGKPAAEVSWQKVAE